jgi:predicted outer membrane protein
MRARFLLFCLCAACGATHRGGPPPSAAAETDEPPSPPPEDPAKPGSEPMVDVQIATTVEVLDRARVAIARAVVSRSSDRNVVRLARRMIDEHPVISRRFERWRAVRLAAPTATNTSAALTSDADDLVARCASLGSPKLDETWTDAVVEQHRRYVVMLEELERQATNAELGELIAATHPTLARDLADATRIQAVQRADAEARQRPPEARKTEPSAAGSERRDNP